MLRKFRDMEQAPKARFIIKEGPVKVQQIGMYRRFTMDHALAALVLQKAGGSRFQGSESASFEFYSHGSITEASVQGKEEVLIGVGGGRFHPDGKSSTDSMIEYLGLAGHPVIRRIKGWV